MAKIRPSYTITMSLEEVMRHNMLEDRDHALIPVIDSFDHYVCPTCGRYVADADGSEAAKIMIKAAHFCAGCGQRLSNDLSDYKDYVPLEEL